MLKESGKEGGIRIVPGVLILILMEHAQRGAKCGYNWTWSPDVLILILMEHAQRGSVQSTQATHFIGLNPCFIGTCSKGQACHTILCYRWRS